MPKACSCSCNQDLLHGFLPQRRLTTHFISTGLSDEVNRSKKINSFYG
jgi:hypothetical protein